MATITGFHHITLVTRSAPANVGFWAGELGLRLVKRTVNFDDPTSYHLYFGDRLGRPGTAVTFFEWPLAKSGRAGIGGTLGFTLGLAGASLAELAGRLRAAGREVAETAGGLDLCDPDGVHLRVEAIPGFDPEREETDVAERWRPGLREIVVGTARLAVAEAFYAGLLGLPDGAPDGEGRLAFRVGPGLDAPRLVAVAQDAKAVGHARHGAGQTHHFAFAVPDDQGQLEYRERLLAAGWPVSPVMDRVYFRSIYTRDPDGHIVELATAGPGFTVDETEESLGGGLRLPPWLEPRRPEIVAGLAPLETAGGPGR